MKMADIWAEIQVGLTVRRLAQEAILVLDFGLLPLYELVWPFASEKNEHLIFRHIKTWAEFIRCSPHMLYLDGALLYNTILNI